MAYTYQQIQSATLDDIKKDYGLRDIFNKLYSGGGFDVATEWIVGNRNFESDKQWIMNSLQRTDSELEKLASNYANWNNPANPTDYQNALKAREQGLASIAAMEKSWTERGIDPTSIPSIQQYKNTFGATPGGGITSQQQAVADKPSTPATTATTPTTPLPTFTKGTLTITPTSQDASGNYNTSLGTFSEADLKVQGFTKVGETVPSPAPPTPPATPTTPATIQKATLYGPSGQKEVVDVGSARASELQSQGWGLTEGSYKAPTSAPISAPTVQKATLYGPNGQKEVVDVGSTRASELQTQGWTLTETTTPAAPVISADKTIYKRGKDLYTKIGNTYYRIPDQKTLYDLVVNQKYNDARTELPADAQLDTWGDIPMEKPTEKPITPGEKQIGEDYVNYLYNLYLGRDANDQEKLIYKNHADDSVIRRDLEFAQKKVTDEQTKADEAAKLAEEQKKVDEAKKAEEEAKKADSLKYIYGQVKQPLAVEELVGNFVGLEATTMYRKGGITKETFDKYITKNTNNAYSKYTNALLYGAYSIDDVYRDLKAKELADQGNVAYQNYKTFDEVAPASEWYNTDEAQKVKGDAILTPPPGMIDDAILNNPIFSIPGSAFATLVEPVDWTSPAFKEEAEKIQASYYDIMTKKAEAETEQQKAIADENFRLFKEDLAKKYGLQLSDNAQTAWGQLQELFSGAAQKGIGQSGLMGEAMDKYLADIRNRDQILRDERITNEERESLNNLLKSGSSEDIRNFVAANPDKAKALGLVPSDEVKNWYSDENLKSLYPDMTDTERANISNSMIDWSNPDQPTYRSDLYQNLYINKYDLGEAKKTWQQGAIERDSSGNIIGGHGLLYQKMLEAEKAYRPYTYTNPFSSFQTEGITPATPAAPAATPGKVVQVKDKNGNIINVNEGSISALIAEGTLPVGATPISITPTAPAPAPAPASAANTFPTATTPAPTPAPSTNKKVQVKDKNGNLITVYEDSIPALIKEGTLPAGTKASTFSNIIESPILPSGITPTPEWGGVGSKPFLPSGITPTPEWGGVGSKPFLPSGNIPALTPYVGSDSSKWSINQIQDFNNPNTKITGSNSDYAKAFNDPNVKIPYVGSDSSKWSINQ